jgi:hypothetical protein
MKHIKKILLGVVVLLALATINTGCKKVLGLKLQENWDFQPVVLDPHINKSAWQFLKDRALGSTPADTIFKRFYDGIIYSGIDTSLYLQSNKTFIFLHNDAIYRLSSNKITTDCYFGYYKTTSNKTGITWTDYPKEQVKNWLLYLIADGNHTFGTVGPDLVETKTLLPENADTKNPESKIFFNIMNDQNMKFRINNFIGTKRYTEARTAGIIATNGPVHVVDRIVEFNQ